MYPTRFWTTGLILTIAALSSPAGADTTKNPQLVAQLKATGTQSDRLKLLPDDATDWTFDFAAQDSYTFSPASVVNANTASWPTVVGNKLTMAMIQLGPCGMLPPHYHPRASNYVVAVMGETHTYTIAENNARTVKTVLTPGKMTIFPQGAIHTMMNVGCENAQLVSALSDEDSGTSNLLNGLFQLPEEFIGAAFGNSGIDVNGTGSAIPPIGYNGIAGSLECMQRCRMNVTKYI